MKKKWQESLGSVEEKAKKPEKRHVHEMHIKRGAKGGFVVDHDMKGGDKAHETNRTGPHVIANAADLQAHVDEHMGDQPAAGEGEVPGGADPTAQPGQDANAVAPMAGGQ